MSDQKQDAPNLNELQKAKLAVLQNAFGICSLPAVELYEVLEKIYWLGFKAGHDFSQGAHHAK